MATVVRETLGEQGWPGGSHTATEPALTAPLAGRGRNSALALGDAGVPYVQKRKGLTCLNRTAIGGNPPIIANWEYRKVSTGDRFHLVVGRDGTLYRNFVGALSTISASLFTSGDHYPDWEVASDLCFIVNGLEQKKYDGTSATKFGIARPTVGTLAGTAGAAGSPNGTYELRITYANSITGHESSASNTAAATVTVVSQAIVWSNIPPSSDPQVDRIYLYVRNTATQRQFYRAGNIASSDTAATTDFVDANLTTVAPSTVGSDPPPAMTKYVAYHQGRVFVATDTALFYTTPLHPEAFDLTNRVETFVDGQRLTGIYSDREVLLIFKEDRTYVLRGSDPNTWSIDLLDAYVGCANHRTITSADDGHLYWWSRQGLTRWNGLNASAEVIGLRTFGHPDEQVFYAEIDRASAAFSVLRGNVLLAVPGVGQARATLILPFNTALGVFEAQYWDPMDCASLGVARDAVGVEQVYLGNYNGQLFTMWSSENDGVASGGLSGTYTAQSSSVTTLSTGLSITTLDTTGAGLAERKVTFIDSNGVMVAIFPRPYIVSNTGIAITLNKAVTLTAGAVYTLYIGGPAFEWETPERTCGASWLRKRFEYLFLLYKGTVSGAGARISLTLNRRGAADHTLSFTVDTSGSYWNVATWNSSLWNVSGTPQERWRVGNIGFAWKATIRNVIPDQPFGMIYVAVQAVMQGTAK